MKKVLRSAWNFFFKGSIFEWCETNCTNCSYNPEVDKSCVDEQSEYFRLQREKLEAIKKCDGCEEDVFVLRKDGVDLGYYSNLGRLADQNGLYRESVYYYWNFTKKNSNSKLFKDEYEIINLR